MKKITLSLIAFLFYSISYSQFIKTVLPTPQFANALEKIVLDFRFGYHTIQIDSTMLTQGEYDTYNTTVSLPGSTDNEIMRFHSKKDSTAAFQAVFYEGDDYDEAVKAYKNCVLMIRKSRMKWFDNRPLTFSGKDVDPDPSVSFATSTLLLNVYDKRYENFCAEINLQRYLTGWQVMASFHTRHSDMEGPTKEPEY